MNTLTSYVLGFVLSALLTICAFLFAPQLGSFAVASVVLAAVVQLLVQLYFFLHVGQRGYPQSNLAVLSFTAVIVGIVVGGTLWIMHNLNHLHMSEPTNTDLYQNGIVAPQNELH